MATAAPAARPDERLVRVGFLQRVLSRPDIGAFLGAVAVWLAFGDFARDVPGGVAGWRVGGYGARRLLAERPGDSRGLDRPGGAVRHRRGTGRAADDRRRV